MNLDINNKRNSGFSLFESLIKEKKRLVEEKLILNKKDKHKYPIKDTPFEIPANWCWCYLSDISIIQEGPGIRKYQYKDEGIQFLTVTNILEDDIDLEKSEKYISLDEYNEKYSHFTINKGDIVTACSGGSWGKSAVFTSDEKLILNTSTLRLRFFNDLGDNKYLYYLTKTDHFKNSLSSYSTGQQPNYGYYHYSRIPIPLPPLPEQHRIVSILDHCFEAIDKVKANAEQNLQNAKELFESYLQGVFEKKGDGWEEKRLGKVCNIIGGGTPSKSKKEYYEGSIPWATVRDMKKFYLDSTQFNITKEAIENSSTNVIEKGNVIIATRVGLGKVCLLEQDTAINQDLKGIIPKQGYEINKDYLFYWFQSIENFLVNSGTGMTVKGVRVDFVKSILFPFPSIAKQEEIVSWLDNIYTKSQNLEFYYQKRIDDLEELKKSILQKAFAGELKTEKMVEETPLVPISESVCCEAEKI